MGLTNSQIVFDSPSDAFYPNSQVTGRLLFRLDKHKKIRAIECKFWGKAETSWTEMHTRTRHHNTGNNNIGHSRTETEHVRYYASEEFFKTKYTLAGSPNEEMVLPPGDYTYPFSMTLPGVLPPSFEGKHGHIRYFAEATLVRPWKFDHTVKKEFKIALPVDLNYNLMAKEPVRLEFEKYFCCCWCRSGPLTLAVRLPFSGYVPGQHIPVTLEVDNASSVRVDSVVISLIKVLKFEAHFPMHKVREDEETLLKLSLDAVEARGSKSYTHHLLVPHTTPYNLDQCSIIKCHYQLRVTAEVSGCHSNLYGVVPIFLGTVPIYQSPAGAAPSPSAFDQASAPPLDTGFQNPTAFIGDPFLIRANTLPIQSVPVLT